MKYKLTNESIIVKNIKLYQIKALKNFSNIKKGSLGGFVESEDNLSQDGDCWIYDKAKVYGNAQVSGNARVYGNAQVFENVKVSGNAEVYDDAKVFGNVIVYCDAKVFGYAKVYDDAEIYGDAQVYDNAKVSDNAQVFNYAQVSGNAQVFGEAWVYGDAKIHGVAHVYGDARVYGDSWPTSPFFLSFTKHSITTISHTHLKIGCKILPIDEWKEIGKEFVGKTGIPDKDIELYIEAIRLAEIHIDLVKRNIKIKEEEIKRWRAEIGGKYWIVHDDFTACEHTDDRHSMDDVNYKNENYFRTVEEAQAAAEDMRKVLLRHAGELHDLQWAISEMKKGNKVRCWRWGVLCYLEIARLYDGSNHYDIFDQKGYYYELSLSELEATDWEIYNEEE